MTVKEQVLKESYSKLTEIKDQDMMVLMKIKDARYDIGYRIDKKKVTSVKDAYRVVISNKILVSRWFSLIHDGMCEMLYAVEV